MRLDELKQWLSDRGFHFSDAPSWQNQNPGWYAWRKSDIPARECECNEYKKQQINIIPYSNRHQGIDFESVEVEICGQAGCWWKLKAYSLTPAEFVRDFDQVESSLVAAWNAITMKGESDA